MLQETNHTAHPILTILKIHKTLTWPEAAAACIAVLCFSCGIVAFTLQPEARTKTCSALPCFAAKYKDRGDGRQCFNLLKLENKIRFTILTCKIYENVIYAALTYPHKLSGLFHTLHLCHQVLDNHLQCKGKRVEVGDRKP